MHYYKRNIGDYAKKAGRLSMLQHGAYTLLIDACYDREQFPTHDEAIEWCWASSAAEIEAIEFVLSRFFTLNASGRYVQKRIEKEIDNYRARAEKNKQIAIDRETKRKESSTKRANDNTKRAQDVNEAPPNHKPLTTNHKPRTINQEPRTKKKLINTTLDFSCWPTLPSEQVLADWQAMRKRIKANISQTVINRLGPKLHEAAKLGYSVDYCLSEMLESNWRGFEVAWLQNKKSQSKNNTQHKSAHTQQRATENLSTLENAARRYGHG